MELTRQEIARRAGRVRSSKARRRRFAKYAEEMAAHPQDIHLETGLVLVEIVVDDLGLAARIA